MHQNTFLYIKIKIKTMTREQLISKIVGEVLSSDYRETESYQLDNLDYAKIIATNDNEVVVLNEHGTEFDIDELSDVELQLFAEDLKINTTTETRVYVVNVDVMETGDKLYHELTDEEFMEQAEQQGTVYTLQGFVNAFNEGLGFSTETHVVRILTVSNK